MENILHHLILYVSQYLQGYDTSHVVQDFFHQQYHPDCVQITKCMILTIYIDIQGAGFKQYYAFAVHTYLGKKSPIIGQHFWYDV